MKIKEATLFTNLEYVTIQPVRTMCHALLLTREEPLFRRTDQKAGPFPDRCMLKGFGTEAAWPVFDLLLPSISFSQAAAESTNMQMMKSDGTLAPLMSGSVLQFEGGPEVQLVSGSYCGKPIRVDTFPSGTDITEIYELLQSRVIESCADLRGLQGLVDTNTELRDLVARAEKL
jgi:hypothetical protein